MNELYTYISIYIITIILSLPLVFNKIGRNNFYGLRTPWALYNDNIWFKSNKISAYLFITVSSISLPLIIIYPYEKFMMNSIFALIAVAFYSTYYSYKLYKKEKSKEKNPIEISKTKAFGGIYSLRAFIFFILSIILVIIIFYYQVLEFGDLNRKMATHFNAQGIADGYMIAKDFLRANITLFVIMLSIMSICACSIYITGKIAKLIKKEEIKSNKFQFLSPLKDMKLLDALTLIFIFTSLFVYEINSSVLNYDLNKEFSFAKVFLAIIYLVLTLFIYSISIWLRTCHFQQQQQQQQQQ